MKLITRVASLFAFMALLSLILYPFYKHRYAGLLAVALGGAVAFLPGARPVAIRGIAARLMALPVRSWLVALIGVGLIVRLPMVFLAPDPQSDFLIYLRSAQRMAAGSGYGDYIFYPPGQAAWLSVWVGLFGANIHLLAAIQCLTSLLTILIVYAGFARYSRSSAMWASAAAALYPSIVIWSGTLGHETLVILLSAIIVWLLGRASESMTIRPRAAIPAAFWWMLCGVAVGLVSLVRPTFVAAPVVMALALWLSRHSVWRSGLAGLVILVSGLLVIAPWTWRNYQHFHKFALISTNFGVTLLSSNHPDSDGIWMETMDIGKQLDPVSQDKLQMRMARQSIAANPGLFVRRTVKRVVYMWGGETSIPDAALGDEQAANLKIRQGLRVIVQIAWASFVVACCLGLSRFRLCLNEHAAPVAWSLLWAGFLFCIHAVLEPAARHHMALIPFLAAAYLPAYGAWLTRSPAIVQDLAAADR
jgi:4-amino-4-deoxy-L-arabinose transferase-like glycosyltransferase